MQGNQIAWDWIERGDGWWSESMLAMEKHDRNPFAVFNLRSDRDGGDPYEFWRAHALKGFDASSGRCVGETFRAAAGAIASPRGEFVSSTSTAIAGKRRKAEIDIDGSEHISIGVMLHGERRSVVGDQHTITGVHELYAYDAAVPITLSLDDHFMAYLTLRREDMGLGPGPSTLASQSVQAALNTSPIRSFFLMHMQAMVNPQAMVDRDRPGRMLDIALDLGQLLLQQCHTGTSRNIGTLRRGIAAAAHRAIAVNLVNPALDATYLAMLLGCTRATLYRAFADQGTSIAAHIRSLRLVKARYLLERTAPGTALEHVLDECGIEDGVHFSRQFRHFFGVRPSDVRGIALEGI